MDNIAIVVVAYNRLVSLKRLLLSLDNAFYGDYNPTLVISVDKSESIEVAEYVKSFIWRHGKLLININETRLGLREHILYCGNLTSIYSAVVILEDDLVVSPFFYNYIVETVDKYKSDSRIAGISLYTHLWNFGANRPFFPLPNGKDIYFLQYAQSWGQVWTKSMWQSFYSWYQENRVIEKNIKVPEYITDWPKASWLKYYNHYISDADKFFVYPYVALSTNFSEIGTHINKLENSFQVPILFGQKDQYKLPDFIKNEQIYDMYFESEKVKTFICGIVNSNDVCVDLYGCKNNKELNRFWITSKLANFKIIKSFGLELRPHELNVLQDVPGNIFYLYDCNQIEKNNLNFKDNEIQITRYDVRGLSLNRMFKLFIKTLIFKFLELMKRKLNWLYKFIRNK